MKRHIVLLFTLLWVTGCGHESEQARFESVRQLVCSGKYDEAVPQLQSWQGKEASRAGLFLGKAYLALGDLDKAESTFRQTARDYPDSLEAHKCRYKLALVTWLKGDPESARSQFTALSSNPDGPLAAEATALAGFVQ